MDKKILSATADTILEKPVRIDIDVLNPRWWEKIGMKLRMMPAKRSFYIRPTTLGNMIRISQLLLAVDVDVYKAADYLDANYRMISQHARSLATVIAVAITNSKKEPNGRLVDFLVNNLTAKEIKAISGIVIQQLDVGDFTHTIISMRGRNILEMSRDNQGGQIASGEQ